jgi:Tat protein secretion system quality control protein TatD with DNase activity
MKMGLKKIHVSNLSSSKFRNQVELANQLGLSINAHSRSAGRPCVTELQQLLGSDPQIKVILHAFDGSPKVIRNALHSK